MSPWRQLIISSVTVIFLCTACKDKQEKTSPIIESITESVYASGTIKSRNQYEVYSTVSGIIKEIMVEEGDTIRKGTPLIVLSNDAAELSTENARLAAEYSAASNKTDRLEELKAGIEIAERKYKNDSTLYERQKNLWSEGIGTKNELDQRELASQTSKKNYEIAVRRYNEVKKEIEFIAKQSRKNLQINTSLQKDFTIRSEVDGMVFSILREKGEIVSPQMPVAVIGNATDFLLELEVDEYDIARIKPGQKTLISLDSYKGMVFEGYITKINPIMNERSGTFTVEAVFTKMPGRLYPNLSTETNIIIQTRERTMTIPRNYLMENDQVMLEDKSIKKVVTGLKDYRKAEIISGLDTTDIILLPSK